MFLNSFENSSLLDHYNADNSGMAKGRNAESEGRGSWLLFPPGTSEKLSLDGVVFFLPWVGDGSNPWPLVTKRPSLRWESQPF